MSIYKKLFAIQQELKAPKGQRNSFGNYNYRSCEDILEGLKPLLAKNECIIRLEDKMEQIGERYYVRARAILIDVETGENVQSEAYAREEETKKGMDGSQITGASSSYARKYALNGLLAIDDTKDSDSTNKHDKSDKSENEYHSKLKKMLLYLCDGDESRVEKALEHYTSFVGKDGNQVAGVSDINKLSDKRFSATYGKIKADYLKKGGEI